MRRVCDRENRGNSYYSITSLLISVKKLKVPKQQFTNNGLNLWAINYGHYCLRLSTIIEAFIRKDFRGKFPYPFSMHVIMAVLYF